MNIRVALYGHQAHIRRPFQAFSEGLGRHGIESSFWTGNRLPEADLVVTWSHRHARINEMQRRKGADYLIMERGYFADRYLYTSLGFNGLNGRAEFYNDKSPNNRFEATGFKMQPWRKTRGHYVLIMGQVSGDCSLASVNIKDWYQQVYEEARQVFDIPVLFRRHPKSKETHFSYEIQPLAGSLEDALKDAYCVITYNSNSGVDAIMAGIPVIAWDHGAMAWDVSTHKIDDPLFYGDRYAWACNLSYCQWTIEEISRGIAWDHLRQRYA